MSSNSNRMPLQLAQSHAKLIIDKLEPMCVRIAVAGSIRRCRPDVGDIDIVLMPRPGRRRDIRARCLRRGPQVMVDGEQNLHIRLENGVEVNFFFAQAENPDFFGGQPSNWGTVLLCRTGSKQFNRRFAITATKQGFHWNPYKGLWRSGRAVSDSERAMFKALKIDYLNPDDRER